MVQPAVSGPCPNGAVGGFQGAIPSPQNQVPAKDAKKKLPIKKGNIVLATSTGMHSGIYSRLSQRNTVGFSRTTMDDQKSTIINFSPNLGYFVGDGFLAGLNLGIASYKLKNVGTTQTRTQFVVGPFARYYGNLTSNGNLKWTAEAMIGFGTYKYKLEPVGTESTAGLFSVGIGPGIAYFLNDKVSVEAAAVYERITENDKDNNVEKTQGGFGLRIGFGVFL